VITFLFVYASQPGLSIEEKDLFYENLSKETLKVNGKCMILGDFNGHVSKIQDGYNGVHGGYGYRKRNVEGKRVLDFADSFRLKFANTWFKKDDEKLITYESGGGKTAIGHIFIGKEEKVRNVKAILCEELMMQHHLVVMDILYRRFKYTCSSNKQGKVVEDEA